MRHVLVAAVVALVLGAGAIYLQRGERAPTAGLVNVPEPNPVDPAPYRDAFPLTPLDAPPVAGETPAARALEQALVPYRKGDYTTAASALDGVLLDHPGESRAALYLGISRLFMDEVPNALEILRPLTSGTPPDVAAEAAWYGLVGIARLRDPSSVETEARALCHSGGPSSQRACAALAAIDTGRQRP
jgi:hypothetical protein